MDDIINRSFAYSVAIAICLFTAGCSPEITEEADVHAKPKPILQEPIEIHLPVFHDVEIEMFEEARIIIPAINIDYMVQGGVDVLDPQYLRRAPVHFQMTDFPSVYTGNVVIGGHRGGPRHFYDIDRLQPGDLIFIDVDGYRFAYAVEWQEIVDKYDWSIIDEITNYPALTLQTCEPAFDPDPYYRLFVRSALVKVFRPFMIEPSSYFYKISSVY